MHSSTKRIGIVFIVVATITGWMLIIYSRQLPTASLSARWSMSESHIDNQIRTVTTQIPNQPCSELYRKNHWITTKGIGRTGNKMFQLATLLATAKITCRTPAVSNEMNRGLSTLFDLRNFTKIDVRNLSKVWRTKGEKCRHSWEMLTLDPAYNWTIGGYLNSWKNFQFHSSYIKSVFTFNKAILESTKKFLFSSAISKMCPKGKSLRIGMHIRRGDFLNLYNSGFRVADVNYTKIAREYFQKMFPNKALCFIVASNDMKWCKTNIRGENVFFSNLTTPGEDMALLSLCEHTIITTGTFGWFGAWLAGGKVVYYSDYPRRDSKNCRTNGDDMMPHHWVPLP